MISNKELALYLEQLLQTSVIRDYCPNGLQVEGRSQIQKVVTGVTACSALIDRAIAANADLLLTHHGYFWKGEQPQIVGIKRQRVQRLLQHDLNLMAYHLPLDVHTSLGNNRQLADVLGLTVDKQIEVDGIKNIVWQGHCKQPYRPADFIDHCQQRLQREPFYIPGKSETITTVAWCTGAAQRYIDVAIDLGVDLYLTGEVSEATVHIARESGIHFISAGHHATERYGIKALGEHLAAEFQLDHEFIDIDNPV